MVRKGLTKGKIVEAYIELLEEGGYKNFSVQKLAEKLNVKAASLYNHITNVDEINFEMGLKTAEDLVKAQLKAMEGKSRQEALWALALAFREFVFSRPESFKMIVVMPESIPARSRNYRLQIQEPIMQVLSLYDISEEQRMHWYRILRSTMHGFVFYELVSWNYIHFPGDPLESYRMAVNNIILALESTEREYQSRSALLHDLEEKEKAAPKQEEPC